MTSLAIRWMALVMLLGMLVRVVIAWDLLAQPDLAPADVWLGLLIGACQDLLALALLSGPLALALLIHARLGRVVLFVLVAVVLVVAFAELFFWWEFESRLNRLVFHYLLFPHQVVVFLEDQFYVSLYAIPVLAIVFVTYRLIAGGFPESFGSPARRLMIGAVVACAATLVLARPWDFSDSRRVNQMASNGYLGVAQAATTDEASWHGRYWSPPRSAAALDGNVSANQGVRRSPASAPLPVKHVVLIVEESFAGETWLRPELRERYMPQLSALMARGVYFDRIYATGSRTTRGLEALLNGFPPLPGIATTQRHGFEHLPSLPRALAGAGFHNVFVYGGWPGFSNFFSYWRALGYVDLTSREDFTGPRHETSWGVADEFLFAKVRSEMTRLSARHERVFLTALTVSHHRPFDFPADRIPFPAEERRSEYAIAYADWALGRFLEDAREDSWFRDTLFVVVADHGPRIRGDAPIPVEGFRIPLLFYSPDHLKPRRVSHLGSAMSVGVTLLDLLGIASAEGLYGENLMWAAEGLVPVEHNYHVGLVSRRGLTILHRGGALSGWRFADDRLVPDEPDLASAARAADLFGGAHAWFYGTTVPAADAR